MTSAAPHARAQSILLFNDECAVCRTIGHWVEASALRAPANARLIVQPIGDDPDVLRSLNPNLDIWDAYDTIHILMPDGSMRVGGEAVAEVLRDLPNCGWFAWAFSIGVVGLRPFQTILNAGYAVLSDLRPLLGCESCGMPQPWVKRLSALMAWARKGSVVAHHPSLSPHPLKSRV